MKKHIFNINNKKPPCNNLFNKLYFDILLIIIEKMEIKDIINFSLTNIRIKKICDYFINNYYNKNKFTSFMQDYHDIKIIDKNTKNIFNTKSYMFYNSINPFKHNGYLFICKIYLDEIEYNDYLPKKGFLKFYLGNEIIQKIKIDLDIPSFYFNNIYNAKIIYNDIIEDKNRFKILCKNRKYIKIIKSKTFPLSYMRDLYIKKDIINNEGEIYKFSNNYLLGPSTYSEEDPIQEIISFKFYNKEYEQDWMVLATFDPRNIFINNEVTDEMISFVIRKKDLKRKNFNNVFVIYNNKKNN